MGGSKWRTFSHGKTKTWITRQCKKCGRFLKKRQILVCDICKEIYYKERDNTHRRERYTMDSEFKNRLLGHSKKYYQQRVSNKREVEGCYV